MTERNDSPVAQQANQGNGLALYSQNSVVEMAQSAGLVPELYVKTIMATCFKTSAGKPVTAEQFLAFMLVAREFGLNPLLKHIHAFPQDGGIQPIVGVDGWLAKINGHPQCDGFEFSYGEEDGDIYCEGTFHRKDRSHPVVIREWLRECKRNTGPWGQMPKRMLRNRVIAQGGRIVFGVLPGTMLDDEGEALFEAEYKVVEEGQARGDAFRQDAAKIRKGIAAPVKSAIPPAGASQDTGAASAVPPTPEEIMAKVRGCAAITHLENIHRKYRGAADNDGYLPEFEAAVQARKAELRGDPPLAEAPAGGSNGDGEVK